MSVKFAKRNYQPYPNYNNTALILTYIVIFTRVLYFFSYGFQLPSSIPSFQPESLSFAFLVGQSTGSKFHLLLFNWKCLNYNLVLKDSSQIQNSCLTAFVFFPFKSLNMPSHCLLAPLSYEEKSAVHLIEHSLCVARLFSCFFKIIFFF